MAHSPFKPFSGKPEDRRRKRVSDTSDPNSSSSSASLCNSTVSSHLPSSPTTPLENDPSSQPSSDNASTPPSSLPLTAHSSWPHLSEKKAPRMRSTLLEDPNTLEKPWIGKKNPRARIAYYLTYGLAFLGVVASGIRCYFAYRSVHTLKGNLCMVLDEEFDTDLDAVFGSEGNWFHEVELAGWGTGEFEMTTSSPNNSYVKDGYLYITPTLTSDVIGKDNVFNGSVYNLTDCTYNTTDPSLPPGSSLPFNATEYYKACSAVSNSTAGSIINPVQSARIRTKDSSSIRYGRVEVRAKLPRGDWLWPAIWMLPVNDTYGLWPSSGEIDIMEARGNDRSYPEGIDYVHGTLNWGPISSLNRYEKTRGLLWSGRRTDYADSFHTYALEWDAKFVRIYVDSRLHRMLEVTLNEPFFSRGQFPSGIENPWANGTNATPFDQPFYLLLSLAIGSKNGWFADATGGKPWWDNSDNAMYDFAIAQDHWYPTWGSNESRSFIIDYVKMWQLC